MPIDKVVLFFLACLLEALVPESNFFMIIAQSLKYGYRASIWGTFGVATAQFLFLLLFAIGFNILESQFHSVYKIMRISGSVYIIILGIEIFYESLKAKKKAAFKPAKKGELFIQGFLSHLSNPKAVLVWTALIPQVLPAYHVSIIYPIYLGMISICTEFCILNSYAWLAHRSGSLLVNNKLRLVRDFVAGGFFLCLGIYLIL